MASIRIEHTIIDANGVRVIEFSLASGTAGPYHRHSHVVEHCYCLTGRLAVDIDEGESKLLEPGEKCTIPARVNHRVRNAAAQEARFLVIQGVGDFDFLEK